MLFAASPPEEPEALAERHGEILLDRFRLRRGPRAPEVDMQVLDLLDQELDRATGGAQLLTRVVAEPLAPLAEHFDLLFVEPLQPHTPPTVDDSALSTASTASSTEDRTGFVRSDAKDETNC